MQGLNYFQAKTNAKRKPSTLLETPEFRKKLALGTQVGHPVALLKLAGKVSLFAGGSLAKLHGSEAKALSFDPGRHTAVPQPEERFSGPESAHQRGRQLPRLEVQAQVRGIDAVMGRGLGGLESSRDDTIDGEPTGVRASGVRKVAKRGPVIYRSKNKYSDKYIIGFVKREQLPLHTLHGQVCG